MKPNGNRYRGCLQTLLHDLMAASLAYSGKPFCSRMRQTSEPERTRSLPNRHLNLRHEDFAMEAPADFGRSRRFEEQCECLDEVGSRFFD